MKKYLITYKRRYIKSFDLYNYELYHDKLYSSIVILSIEREILALERQFYAIKNNKS